MSSLGLATTPGDLVAPGVRRVRIPVPVPTIRWVNVFLIEGSTGWTLVDTGFRSPESEAAIRSTLAAERLRTADIKRVFITHRHPDHLGMAETLLAAGVELLMHGPEYKAMRLAAALTQERTAEASADWFARHGMPAERVQRLRPAMGYRPPTLAAVTSVADGETLDLGGRSMRVRWTPGHTDYHAVLVDEREQLLFSGDHVLPRSTSNVMVSSETDGDPLGEYLVSLRSLRALPIRVLLPGHGDPIDDLSGRIDELLAHHEARLEKTSAMLEGGERDAYSVSRAFVSGSGTMWEERVAVGETLAHLRHLERRGRVREISGSPTRWHPATGTDA